MKIDYSQLSCFIDCPFQYNLKYILGLSKRTMDKTNIDKEFGSCFHDGLASYYRGKSREAILDSFSGFIDIEGEKYKTRSNGIRLLSDYVEHYQDLGKMEILGVEVKDSFKIGNIEYIVKIDLIVRINNNIYAMEHKSTKSISYNFFDKFNPDMQVSGYTDYVKRKFGQCSGVFINVAQAGWIDKPKLFKVGNPECGKYSNREVKYSKYYKSDMEYCSGFFSELRREIVNRTDNQLKDFELDVQIWASRLEQACISEVWGKNTSTCDKYRGCEFKEICLTKTGNRLDPQIEEALYEEVDPYEYLKEGK